MNTLDTSHVLEQWVKHNFYAPDVVVLGIDMGIQGIGIAVRKGDKLIYCKTLLLELPKAKALETRRQFRAARHARKNRRVRMRRLRELFQRHQLPWVDDDVSSRSDPILLRYRAIFGSNPLASREALSLCIRSCVERRGYDYYAMTGGENEEFPWGEEPKFSDAKRWLSSAYVDEEMKKKLLEMASLLKSRGGELSEKERGEWEQLIDEQAEKAKDFSIPAKLKEYAGYGVHTNKRRWKGLKYPRSHVEAHLRDILERHRHLIQDYDDFCKALFLPCTTKAEKKRAIFHYNRKTPAEAEKHYQKKIKRCPYCSWLGLSGAQCGTQGDKDIRKWNVVDFVSNRTFEWTMNKLPLGRLPMPEAGVRVLLEAIDNGVNRWSDIKKAWEKALRPYVLGKGDWNTKPLQQLKDLLAPGNKTARAGISPEAARELLKQVTSGGTCYDPASMEQVKKEIGLYEERKKIRECSGTYPQAQLLLGALRKHPREGQDAFAVHGFLQKLFETELAAQLDGKKVPDYCVIECVRNAPANQDQKSEMEKKQAENRKRREKQAESYGKQNPTRADYLRMRLFEEQGGGVGKPARCPFTGEELGTDPFDRDHLELAHLFPNARGGLYIVDNLVLTRRETNAAMGNRTPREAAAAALPGWLSWEEMQRRSKSFRWGKMKDYLFAFTPTENQPFPDFNDAALTRPAQLAVALRHLAACWMGIDQDPEAMRQRIGTPSGSYTAAARRGMLEEGYVKDRSLHEHHRIDAAVMTCIPPAEGINNVRYGGIFLSKVVERSRRLSTLEGLPPFELRQELEKPCETSPIISHRGDDKSRSLGDSTFWRVDAERMTSQRTPLLADKKVTAGNILATLRRMGISPQKLPTEKEIQKWLERRLPLVQGDPDVNQSDYLLLSDGRTPVKRIWKFGDPGKGKGNLQQSPLGWSGIITGEGKFHQLRKLGGTNDRMEIWLGWDKDRKCWKYQKRPIPTARALEGLKRMGIPWRGREGSPSWLTDLLDSKGAKDMKTLVCGTLPPHAQKVGVLRKGDVFHVKFKVDDNKLKSLKKPPNFNPNAHPVITEEKDSWGSISAINSNEQVEFKCLTMSERRVLKLRKVSDLARLLGLPEEPERLAREMNLIPPS